MFLLSDDNGDIVPESDQGLYFHDMRYLSAQTLELNGQRPVSLLADASEGDRVLLELTNPELCGESGDHVPKESIAIRRERTLGDEYTETITVRNFGRQAADLRLELRYAADFADMFVVRGMHPGRRGTLHAPTWHGSHLTFRYDGADEHIRTTRLDLSHAPDERNAGELRYHLKLKSRDQWNLRITCHVREDSEGSLEAQPGQTESRAVRDISERADVEIETSEQLLNQIITRSFVDLRMLSMRQKGLLFFAAGVPWYVALFGRDSLITSIEMSAFQPQICANAARVLAGYQGTQVDDWRDEQPGKILHELRVDELANLDEIPQTPYYGSIDSTPLFLVLIGIHAAWTGTLDLFHELADNVRAALDWIDHYGDSNGDGFIDYQTRSPSGARNQGWKDSADGIVMEDGRLAEPPIALPEVQGDVYLAWRSIADLFERDGQSATADSLRRKAERLYAAFNEQFWLHREHYFAFCRQADGRFSKSIASNPAHALWTGIVDPERAQAVVDRVLEPDMFSGWGIRTLSSDDSSFNPVEYQLGSVWPHDNAMIVAGMQRYGFTETAGRVFTAITQAATQFEHFRLPELFAGYERSAASRPVKYPVACNPQAWAAGAIPFMLASLLGLRPDALNEQLHIQRPYLPEWLNWVDVRCLRIGPAEVDLHYERSGDRTLVAVTRKRGDVLVSVES